MYRGTARFSGEAAGDKDKSEWEINEGQSLRVSIAFCIANKLVGGKDHVR